MTFRETRVELSQVQRDGDKHSEHGVMQFLSRLVILVETSSLRFDEVGNSSNFIETDLPIVLYIVRCL